MENEVWELVPISEVPEGMNITKVRWVLRIKYNPDDTVDKYKARICAKGFTQMYGIDYNETFAPVIRMTILRMLLAIAIANDWDVLHVDVKTAFLNAFLKEEVYCEQPEGFEVYGPNGEKLVCRMKKAIYGLKQAPRNWNEELTAFIKSQGFRQSKVDHCLFIRYSETHITIILVYVDDLQITGSSRKLCEEFIKDLGNKYNITNKGDLQYYNGLEIVRDKKNKRGKLHQEKYIRDILKEFKMEKATGKDTPLGVNDDLTVDEIGDYEDISLYRSIVGKLLWLSVCTRPDITTAVSRLSRALQKPSKKHWIGAKRLLRYLKNTKTHGLTYGGGDLVLHGWSDSDWAGTANPGRRSTSGWIFLLNGAAVSWSSKPQQTAALSSTEAEYIAACSATQETMYLRAVLRDLGFAQGEATPLHADNTGCIQIANNPVFHARTKHIELKYHYIREKIETGDTVLVYENTEHNIADFLTKILPRLPHEKFTSWSGVTAMKMTPS